MPNPDNKQRAVLVTGGAGYIGSHACKALAAAGYRPVTFDNLERGHRELVKWGPLEIGDLRDAGAVFAAIERHAPVGVMHFAALCYVGESVEKPGLYWQNNVEGSRCLLAAMKQAGCRNLIFSSTCATYGEPREIPIPEDHPQNPVNPYGETKLQVECDIAAAARDWGLKFVNLRYFNAAGADPEGETGELHEPETHLLPLALQAALGEIPELQVFGDDYPTPDGTCIRDYIHVSDLVDAHVLALGHLLEGGASRSYNLANGQGYSVRQVIDTVEQVTGSAVPARMAPRREGDPPVLIGNAGLIGSELGWYPRLAALETMVRTAWNFQHPGQVNS